MRQDHEEHDDGPARIDGLTGGLALLERACRSWQALYLGTLKLTRDLHCGPASDSDPDWRSGKRESQ